MPSARLTPEEKARCRHHTGYPEVEVAASIQFGVPRPAEMAFLLESAMDHVMEVAVPRVRDILNICDNLEQQLVDAQAYLVADQLEELKLAGSGDPQGRLVTERLEAEYKRWACRLADLFGVPLYPFSTRFGVQLDRRRGGVPVRNS